MKTLTAFYIPIIRLFGYVSAAGVVWVCASWAYHSLASSNENGVANGSYAIMLVVFLLLAVLCLGVNESKPSEMDD